DAARRAESLPLLEFVLEKLWERRRSAVIPWEAWSAMGGLRGAIARRAETMLSACADEGGRGIVERMFGRLVHLSDGASGPRRYGSRAEIEAIAPGAAGAVLEAWISARLLTADGTQVWITHEAVIREWRTLRGWLSRNRETLRMQGDLGI